MVQKTNPKERSTDRIIVIRPLDGKKVLATSGLVDVRLFTGDNKLHGIKDSKNNLWYFKYDFGGLPEPLKQRFISFDLLMRHARQYFLKRNIEIVEVID